MCETRKSSLLGKITILFVICCCSFSAHAKYGGGTGDPNDPYLIYTAEQMNQIGLNEEDWDKNFKLMADIDLSTFTGTSFNIIGYYVSYSDKKPFTGVFDGNDHTISNFTHTSTDRICIGLFGYIHDPNAEIKNLRMINPNVDTGTGRLVGSLVGWLYNGTISACYTEGASVSGMHRISGLVGRNDSTITNCYSTGSISGTGRDVGGLVGANLGTITNCYSKGSVSGDKRVGGLAGHNHYAIITNCYSNGNVAGGDNVGGLVGKSEDGTISNCYATDSVSGLDYVGGLVGSGSTYVVSSYWDIETSGQTTSAGGKGKTTAQMMMEDTFVHWGTCDQVWTINEGVDYPRLVWEQRPGEPIVDTFPFQGDGVPDSPYLILTPEQLNVIGLLPCVWDKHFKLMADIDLSGFTGDSFNIIGRWTGWDEPYNKPFIGVFDGDDHKISNFTWSSVGPDGIGLFEYVGRDGRIENLSLENVNIDAGNAGNVGGLVGFNEGTIINCYCTGSVSAAVFVGGLVGLNKGTITKCYSTTSVLASAHVGGVVGENSQGTITDSYSTGSVSGDRLVGGLVGYSYRGTITECYSTGGVSGKEFVGGLIGYNDYGAIINCYAKGGVLGNGYSVDVGGLVGKNVFGRITNCYSTGSVEAAPGPIGGLVADNYYGTVTASFWDIETSGQTSSDGGTGKTTAEMQMASTFTDAGWGCGSAWTIDQDIDYPRLFWENMPGELITIPSVLYGGGSGEPNDPYLIYTAEQLNTIGVFYCDWDKHFKLMEDIDLREFTGTSFNIIGTHWTSPFAGVFDGNGHTISNFTYISTDTNYIGLFAYVTGEIKDLGLINPDVDAGNRDCVGSLVGCLSDGTITNCYVEGGSVAGDSGVGGLVGCNSATITNSYSSASVTGTGWSSGGLVGQNDAIITNCCSTGSVSGNERVGGLVGKNGSDGTITNSYATGRVTGTYDYVGGLVGRNERGTISNCYSVASVSGDDKVGGLVGYNYRGTISNSYSTGSVSGVNRVGGLLGYNYYGTITNCYSIGGVSGESLVGGMVGWNVYGWVSASFWDTQTSGQTTSDGGTGKTTAELQTASTFIDAGWDFVGETLNGIEDVWFIPQQDYPHLWWEGMQVSLKLTPLTLNCRSYGNWVKAHLILPEGFTVADVDADRPAVLHSFGFESAPLYVFVNENELVEIEAAFERQAVCSLSGDWPQMLTVAGFLADGNIFLGTSKVRIIHPGMKVIEELAWYWLNEDCVHPDFCNEIDMNRDSLVNLLDYALLMNINVEFVTDE